MDELPPSWKIARGADLFRVIRGVTYRGPEGSREAQIGHVPLLRATNIQSGRLIVDGTIWVPQRLVSSEQMLRHGDLVVATSSGSLDVVGKAAPVSAEIAKSPITFGAFCATLRPYEGVEPGWIAWFLQTQEYRNWVREEAAGININNLKASALADLPIPVPPPAEQRRVVARIEAQFARTRRARAELGRVVALADRYERQLLTSAFDEAAESWPMVPLGTLITAIEAGKNMRCEERRPAASERGIVKISAVTWGEFDPTQIKTAPSEAELDPRSLIRNGDFLLSRANTLELVGAPVIARNVPEHTYLSDKVLRLRFKQDVAEWVLWFLRGPRGRAEIEGRASGNQLSMRNLGQAELRAIPIPLPPVDVRVGMIQGVATRMAKNRNGGTEATRALALLNRLEAAILARAFRGELVPQDPADEPARLPPPLAATRPRRARAGPSAAPA